MENTKETERIEREFGHCIVDWEIENYGFAAHGMQYEIKSSSFSVRPHMTTWRMALKSELGLCDDTDIQFCLERMTDSGPDTVWVNMDISFFDQDGKEWNTPRGQYRFQRNDRKVLYVPNIYFGRVNVGLYNFNAMTLRCQMIVHEKKSRCRRDDCIDYGLMCLSIDMEQLYRFTNFSDVTLKLDNGAQQTEVHRAILSARSEILKDVFSRDALPVFKCLSLQYDEARQVLKYLYTGDVGNILDKPSVSAADCITAFSVHELDDHYRADEQKLKSSIDVHQTGLMWNIEDFSKRDEECISSHVIFGDIPELAWQLFLYPRGIGGKEDHLTITAENTDGKIDGDVWAKIEVFHDPYDRIWKTMQVVKVGELFELHNFETRKSVFEKLENDTLKICFKVCVSTGETHSSNVQKVYPVPNFPCDYYYKKLSKDISALREDTRFTDVVVYAEGKQFKAHKCILSVRSAKLRYLSDDLNEDKVICFDNVRPDIVEIVLDYMYSGVLKKLDFNIMLEVYEAACKMGVNYLVYESSQFLKKSLNEDNVFKALMSANGQRDECLKDGILKFLTLNVNIYEETLKKLELENSDLSTEVEKAFEKLQLTSY